MFPAKNANRVNQSGVKVFLDELLALRFQARGLDLFSRQKVMTLLAGGYQSGFRGRGIDFEETRHYQAGDDIRAMDWRVTARSGHPHTKIFREERERPIFLAVDYSPSMVFGTRTAFKTVIAAQAAALLAWATAEQRDRVGGIVFSAAAYHELRPLAGKRGVLHLLKALADNQPDPSVSLPPASRADYLAQALIRLRRIVHPGSLICLLSDFYSLTPDAERHLKQLTAHSDMLGILIYDPLEAELPAPAGRYAVSDGEHLAFFNSFDRKLREQYHAHFQSRSAYLTRLFNQRGLRLLSLATSQPIAETLRQELQTTRKKR